MSSIAIPTARRRGVHPLLAYTARRVGIGILLAFAITVVVFAVTQVLPGDPADAILGRNATPESKAILREELGLDRPILVQYGDWVTGVFQGDLGESIASHRPVGPYLWERLTNSLALALATLVVIIPLSLLLGVWGGVRADRAADHVISATSLALIALPEFVTGTLIAIFIAVKAGLVPPVSLIPAGANPLAHPDLLMLPVATLTVAGLAYLVRMVRAGVVEAMSSEYVEMARLNGLPERRVVWRHGLRNSLATTVQVAAATVQWLIGGVVVVETVFQYPGIGLALVQAVASRDIPVVQAITLVLAFIYLMVNIVADLAVVLLIPKLRTTA